MMANIGYLIMASGYAFHNIHADVPTGFGGFHNTAIGYAGTWYGNGMTGNS